MAHELALDELGAALLALHGPWTVLRDADAADGENGFGASFVAFHPEKGIALVGLAPARLSASVTWLRVILIHAGGGAFTVREPPIAPVPLSREEIPNACSRVEASFADMPGCSIPRKDWPRQAIAALAAEHVRLMPLTVGVKPKFNSARASTSDALKPADPGLPADEKAPAHLRPSLAREAPTSNALQLDVPRIDAPTIRLLGAHMAPIVLPCTFIAAPQPLSPSRPQSPPPDVPGSGDPAAPLPAIPSAAPPQRAVAAFALEDAHPAPIDPGLGIEREIAAWRMIRAVAHERAGAFLEYAIHAGLPSLRDRLGTLKMRVHQSLMLRFLRQECTLVLRSNAVLVLTRGAPEWPRIAAWAILAFLLGVLSPSIFRAHEVGGNGLQRSSEDTHQQPRHIPEANAIATAEAPTVPRPASKQPEAKPPAVNAEAARTKGKAEIAAKTPPAPAIVTASRNPVRAAAPDRAPPEKRVRAQAPGLDWERLAAKLSNNTRPYDGPEYDYANRQSW